MAKQKNRLKKIHFLLQEHFGDLGWWPASSRFEVIVGAVLTQNTAWNNVEKAIKALKKEKLMSPGGIVGADARRLSRIIRPAGYYSVKAQRLKAVSGFINDECGRDIKALKKKRIDHLRKKLLAVRGIGPETADSILLYALDKGVFVVDAYTRRIFSRHGLVPEDASYEKVQSLVHRSFTRDAAILNQFHALLVEAGKKFCKKNKPLCSGCPLNRV